MRSKTINTIAAIIIVLLIGHLQMFGQQNGLLTYDASRTYEGYTLAFPHNQSSVYIIDNCGAVVHQWDDEATFRPGNTAYLKEDGNLLRLKRLAAVGQDAIWAGGGGDIIEIVDWDGNSLWSFSQNNDTLRLHHDVALIPNGNILAISWEKLTKEEAIALGRDSTKISQDQLWPDYIFEIDPSTSQIVWEWHTMDHVIQDFDSTKSNYGVIADHPELVDLNYDTSNGAADWMHSNAIDYNADLDQILLSVPTFNEIWIIDHSTTTTQAASHIGGKSNRGGDLMYRIGNPAAYGNGTEADQILFYQHDVHWNTDLPINHPDYGKIMVFNNRVGADYSSVEIFNSPWNMYDWAYDKAGAVWMPTKFDNTIRHPGPKPFVSSGLSSAQRLPNNNTLMVSGRQGYWVELDPNGQIVWEYVTPLKAGVPVSRLDTLEINNNLTFRIYKYSPDYPAFDDKDLTNRSYIEIDPDPAWCGRLVSIPFVEDIQTNVYPNPAGHNLAIEWSSGGMVRLELVDLMGRSRLQSKGNGGMCYLDVASVETGMYILLIDGKAVSRVQIAR